MMATDRGKFAKEAFSYQIASNEKVFIFWQGRQIKTLKGKEAQKLIHQIEDTVPEQVQCLLAKITKNFKRGNEKKHPIPRKD